MQVLSISAIIARPTCDSQLAISLLKVPCARQLAEARGSGINIRIDMLSSLCRGSRPLPILFLEISPRVCMSGYCKFPLRYPIICIRHFVIVCSWLFSPVASPSSKPRRSKGISGTERRYHQRIIGASRSTAGGIGQITICQWQFVGNSQQTEK